jgi:hypothetical protein
MEEGREMSCASVTRALSDGDGRVTRRRDVRAHLRNCAQCQAFREEIKSRQHDLAALSPLPALAAAGMLQGLVGGSQGAATGGSLATTLGGGAAKTIGASAAAKGVATAAVVAAIGVTAADRSGVVHLGLPGEQSTKSAQPTPGSAGAAPSPRSSDAVTEGSHDHSNGSEGAHGHPQPHEEVSGEAQGPQVEHPSGQDHEKQHPDAASDGQETAVVHKAVQEAAGGKSAEHAVPPVPPVHPTHPTHPAHPETPASLTAAPPEEAPANPPAPAPTPPAPTLPPQATEKAQGPPPGSPSEGKRPEKAP